MTIEVTHAGGLDTTVAFDPPRRITVPGRAGRDYLFDVDLVQFSDGELHRLYGLRIKTNGDSYADRSYLRGGVGGAERSYYVEQLAIGDIADRHRHLATAIQRLAKDAT
jgi:hypothetical protein